jgi:NADH-quinone oxidoreductase subunit L
LSSPHCFCLFQFKNYQPKEEGGLEKFGTNGMWMSCMTKIIVNPFKLLGFTIIFERFIIDGIVNGVGRAVNYGSRQLRLIQSGQVGSYVLLMVLSILLLLLYQFFIKK